MAGLKCDNLFCEGRIGESPRHCRKTEQTKQSIITHTENFKNEISQGRGI
ncbi:hypothetical protein [Helicobacter rodentium]|nr:hypothetical protein [Helicobacter rodentium]